MLLSPKIVLPISPIYLFLNLNCFYSIFTKKRNSHGHFKCIKKHKIISRSCCLSAIMVLSYYFMLKWYKYPTVIMPYVHSVWINGNMHQKIASLTILFLMYQVWQRKPVLPNKICNSGHSLTTLTKFKFVHYCLHKNICEVSKSVTAIHCNVPRGSFLQDL